MTSLNAPCPCGSGKKFKRCHGKAQSGVTSKQSPQQILEQARALTERGQNDAALQQLSLLPPTPARYDLEVKLLQQQGIAGRAKAEKILIKWQHSDCLNPDPVYRRMRLAWQQDKPEQALLLVKELAARPHKLVDYYSAVALQLCGSLDEAMAAYLLAVTKNLSIELDRQECEFEAAIQMYETVAGQYPGSRGENEAALIDAEAEYEILLAAATNWWQKNQHSLAINKGQKERYSNAFYNLGCRDQACYGRGATAMAHFETTLKIQPEHLLAQTNKLFGLNYLADLKPAEVSQAHILAGTVIRQQLGPAKTDFKPATIEKRRLRVGYLSADFRKHSVAYFITPVLEAHDRERFKIFAYYNQRIDDNWSHRVQRCVDVFRPVADLGDSALYQQILADRIDVLVDLSGYSRGHRLGVLGRRAAPVQMAWIGYPNTSGLDVIDYRIVDEITDPQPQADDLCSEKLLRLKGSFSVYTPPEDLPAASTPDQTGGGFVFGSFNHMLKINQPLLETWAEILTAAPESRLLIKNGLVDRKTARRDLMEDLVAAGIDTERVDLLGRVSSSRDHLSCYRKVDLLLDSFPYNGTTTNCDGFIMGIPVLTIAGDSHISRVTSSQLSNLGLTELIASDREDYIRKALELYHNPERLTELATGLRERMRQSPLMDASTLTAQVESFYLESWLQYTDI